MSVLENDLERTQTKTRLSYEDIRRILGDEADYLLNHVSKAVPKEHLVLPAPDFVDQVWGDSDRSDRVLRNMHRLYGSGRLADTGYLSILPVDQGVEHSAGAEFAANPMYFDPENIIKLAVAAECNAVASTIGVLGTVAKRYAEQIPFIVKLNHNQLLTYPKTYDQIMFTSVEKAYEVGAVAVGATIYFGSPESDRQIIEVAQAFARAHELGLVTILWCYVRNSEFKHDGTNYERSADITAQANHLGATIEADIVKQKLPETNGGFAALNQAGKDFGYYDERMYTELATDHPIDLARYQVLNGYAGRVGLISSGGAASGGDDDFRAAVRTAVINKRAGGMGLITGRKAFQRPFGEGVQLIQAIQDVYLCDEVTIA
ncbi:class I fructose-bisphosphate aldolase [Candidatus Woesebacteria bacterium]|nr:class I fructose-bisphosphate aldolase [Candidatus Woesebacteria bacterium]MCD8507582.1 class I fructose-bisphosphate aldolase [Candidatus Woesebacteria bacterium]MCD8527424.1 class I fructose-bisphosphate aldolase [Candidatus Woesebacteria bacterium]MCD8546169.1 class I fructose-bisphosphate aldolase [Candidatus Woesebacteria bacterium]